MEDGVAQRKKPHPRSLSEGEGGLGDEQRDWLKIGLLAVVIYNKSYFNKS